jgi:stringent starvation protein B
MSWFKKFFSWLFPSKKEESLNATSKNIAIHRGDNKMTSIRPYLFNAVYNWIKDNKLTPLIVVDVHFDGVKVPSGFDVNGLITLDLSDDAIDDLTFIQGSTVNDIQLIKFVGIFNDVEETVSIPMNSLQAIYCLENDEGFSFAELQDEHDADLYRPAEKETRKAKKASHLTVIK